MPTISPIDWHFEADLRIITLASVFGLVSFICFQLCYN